MCSFCKILFEYPNKSFPRQSVYDTFLFYLVRHIFPRSGDSQHSVSSEFGGNLLWVDAGRKSEPLLKLAGDVGLPSWSLVLLFRGDDQNISFGLDVQILVMK